jgi:hypothetical protein
MLVSKCIEFRTRNLQAAFVAIDAGDMDTGPGEAERDGAATPPPAPVTTATRPDRPSQSDELCSVMAINFQFRVTRNNMTSQGGKGALAWSQRPRACAPDQPAAC